MKFTILLVVSFSLGFALHWLITSTQVQSVSNLSQNVLGKMSNNDQFITYIDYDDKGFKPSVVIIKKGNYIAITNKSSDQLMWLISDNPNLQTLRGYGEGEKLQLTLLKEGTYKVTNRLNTRSSLQVTVEP